MRAWPKGRRYDPEKTQGLWWKERQESVAQWGGPVLPTECFEASPRAEPVDLTSASFADRLGRPSKSSHSTILHVCLFRHVRADLGLRPRRARRTGMEHAERGRGRDGGHFEIIIVLMAFGNRIVASGVRNEKQFVQYDTLLFSLVENKNEPAPCKTHLFSSIAQPKNLSSPLRRLIILPSRRRVF